MSPTVFTRIWNFFPISCSTLDYDRYPGGLCFIDLATSHERKMSKAAASEILDRLETSAF